MQQCKSAIAAGVWCVCLDLSLNPSTWGCVSLCNGNIAYVSYGKDALIWIGNTWEAKYLQAYVSQVAAKKAFEDYRNSVEYDSR